MEYRLPARLSFTDIARLDVCKNGACSTLPFEQLLGIAYKHGLNTKEHYEVLEGLHRTLTGDRVDSKYIIAEERLDKEWIKSGNASMEAIIRSSKDKYMRADLKGLQPTKSIEQHQQ